MHDIDQRPVAPDYTRACIIMFGVNLSWLLLLAWAIGGLVTVALLGWALNRLISRLALSRS
jgi:hypothetical protein